MRNPSCKRCPLHETANSVCIDGDGPLTARVLVVGLAPGREEDRDARPFVGRSGVKLRKILQYLDIGPVRIETGVVRCRPPDNRKPTAAEIKACRPYLEAVIAQMPLLELVISLGAEAMHFFGIKGAILSKAGGPVGTTVQGKDLTVLPLAHPAYLLRNKTYADTWGGHWHLAKTLLDREGIQLPVPLTGDGVMLGSYSIDLETSHLHPEKGEVISYAVCGLQDGPEGGEKVVARYVSTPGDLLDCVEALRGPSEAREAQISASRTQPPLEGLKGTGGPRMGLEQGSEPTVHNKELTDAPQDDLRGVQDVLGGGAQNSSSRCHAVPGPSSPPEEYPQPATRSGGTGERHLTVHHVGMEGRWAEFFSRVLSLSAGVHHNGELLHNVWSAGRVRDTLLMSKRLEPARSHSLASLVNRHLPELAGFKADSERLWAAGVAVEDTPPDVLLERNAVDAYATWALGEKLWNLMLPRERDMHSDDVRCALTLARLARKGLHFDMAKAAALKESAEVEKEWCRARTGINPASNPDVQARLRDMGVELPLNRKTKKPTTGEPELRKLMHSLSGEALEFCELVLRYRRANKISGTYVGGYARRVEHDGCIRSDFFWTVTWRPRSSNPNILNVMRDVRGMFTAPPGYVVFEADYSQAELRRMAALSGDPSMTKAYRENKDLHTRTASAIFPSADPISKVQRYAGKTTNFQSGYRGGAGTLQNVFLKQGKMFVPIEECRRYQRAWRSEYQVYWDWSSEQIERARRGETLEVPEWAYRFKLDDFLLLHPDRRDEAERGVLNAIIQSVPPRMVFGAIHALDHLPVDVRLHTYDGMVGYLPQDLALDLAPLIKQAMEDQASDVWGEVPVVAGVSIGPSWGELEEVC